MLQTVLMFLASPQNPARPEHPLEKRPPPMATRARSPALSGRDEARDEVSAARRRAGPGGDPDEEVVTWPAVIGNALGFSLLMVGLWLVLRLAETLMA